MNKTILIAGGASLASLAIGGAAGYYLGVKKMAGEFEKMLDEELAKAKKVYAVRYSEANASKPASPADIPKRSDSEDSLELEGDDPEEDDELSEEDTRALGRRREQPVRTLVDYRNFAKDTDNPDYVEKNIFTESATTPPKTSPLPPRSPENGRFTKRADPPTPTGPSNPQPYRIMQEDFLRNEHEFDSHNYIYFPDEEILVDVENDNETIDLGIVGQENLTAFPEPDENGYSAVFICNERMGRVIEIRLSQQSLTSFVNLAETGMDDSGEYELENV